MKTRILTDVALVLLIIFVPYWIYLPVIAAGILYFNLYWEGLVFSMLVDVLYGTSGGGFFLLNFPATIGSIILFIGSPILRRRLRVNHF